MNNEYINYTGIAHSVRLNWAHFSIDIYLDAIFLFLVEILSLMAHIQYAHACTHTHTVLWLHRFQSSQLAPNNITSIIMMMIILLKTQKWFWLHWKWFISHNIRITISFIVILYASLIVVVRGKKWILPTKCLHEVFTFYVNTILSLPCNI